MSTTISITINITFTIIIHNDNDYDNQFELINYYNLLIHHYENGLSILIYYYHYDYD